MRKSLIEYLAPVGEVELWPGRWVEVMPLDGASWHALNECAKDGRAAPEIPVAYKIAAQVLPSLTPDEVMRLTNTQVGEVIGMATEPVTAAIEGADPNAVRPPAGPSRSA